MGWLRAIAAELGHPLPPEKPIPVCPNVAILEHHRELIETVLRKSGDQAAIDYANSLIDVSLGIVAGDGCYYPRAGYPE